MWNVKTWQSCTRWRPEVKVFWMCKLSCMVNYIYTNMVIRTLKFRERTKYLGDNTTKSKDFLLDHVEPVFDRWANHSTMIYNNDFLRHMVYFCVLCQVGNIAQYEIWRYNLVYIIVFIYFLYCGKIIVLLFYKYFMDELG